jgi:tetratricopeptide (TPR) repeat protein
VWKRRARGRRLPGDWPSLDEIDEVIADRRTEWPTEPSQQQTTELAELLLLRGLRDVELKQWDSAIADLRDARGLIGHTAEPLDAEHAQRERAITVAWARAEVNARHVAAAVQALTEVLALPYPHPGSETRATVQLLLDANEIRAWAHREGRHEEGLRLALQGHGLAATVVAQGADRGFEGLSLVFVANSYAATGDLDNALATADSAIALLRANPGSRATLITTLRMKRRLLREAGRPEEAEAAEREAAVLEGS